MDPQAQSFMQSKREKKALDLLFSNLKKLDLKLLSSQFQNLQQL